MARLAGRAEDVREWQRFTGKARRKSKVEYKDLIGWDITGSERITSGIARLAPGKVHGKHSHPHACEVYHVLKGRAKISLGDEELEADEGTEVFIPKGMRHGVVNDGDEDFLFVWLMRGKYSMDEYE